jgi:uncharacterized protein YijF (DUF1287 family)
MDKPRLPLLVLWAVSIPALAIGGASCSSPQQAQARSASPKADSVSQRIVRAARSQIGTRYTQQYFSLSYPNGDPPKDLGACTDVVVRALRPAGYDLQKLIHEDMRRNFGLYPRKWGLRRPDRNIDHRRVPNQRVYFKRFGQELPIRTGASAWAQWKPGDIVFWKLSDTGESGLDHVGIVSDKRASNGRPLVIHNLGGCREEDALTTWRIVGHFRFPRR